MAADALKLEIKDGAGSILHTINVGKNVLDFDAAPTTSDDDTAGFVAGSFVVDRTTDTIYDCTDNSTGAAVWQARGTGGGGGISDGDKGDLTVSSSGTVWTIDNDVVTYAKMQNVSATDKLLGRSTAGAGDVEEIACVANGRALIATNYAGMRALLDLEAGTDFYSIAAADAAFQPKDATLTSLAAYNTNGLLTQTAADTFTGRTLTGTSNQISVADGNGVAGNPTLSLPTDFRVPGAIAYTGDITYDYSLSLTETDWAPTGLSSASRIRVTCSSGGPLEILTIGGITGGVDGRILTITLPSADATVVINHENAGSTASNRILLRNSSSITLTAYTSITLQYDATISRWVDIGDTAAETSWQPIDATLTALAGADWAANSLAIGSGANTVAQVTFAANRFPARASTGNLVAKTITDASLTALATGLGTSATVDTGTSGTKVALTDGANQWSAGQRFINSSGITILDTNASHTLGLIVGSDLTANRTLTITTGDASRSLTISGTADITGTNTGDQVANSQSDQETGTDTTKFVSAGTQKYHPSACKAWISVSMIAAGWTIQASYNVSSVTDSGVGIGVINLTTAFSSSTWTPCAWGDSDIATASNAGQMINQTNIGSNTWTFRSNSSAGAALDFDRVTLLCFGDQ